MKIFVFSFLRNKLKSVHAYLLLMLTRLIIWPEPESRCCRYKIRPFYYPSSSSPPRFGRIHTDFRAKVENEMEFSVFRNQENANNVMRNNKENNVPPSKDQPVNKRRSALGVLNSKQPFNNQVQLKSKVQTIVARVWVV